MASPIRASKLPSLDHLDPEKTMRKIKGHDLDLMSPKTSPRSSTVDRDRDGPQGGWLGSQKFAADLKRLALNRHLRDLRSKQWQERLRACQFLGKNLTLRSYKGVARLVDVIATEKDSNVIDAALRALLQINGHNGHGDGASDFAAGSPGSLGTPLQSTAGLTTPMTGASTPLKAHSPMARPWSGVRPTSAAARITPTISEDGSLPADHNSQVGVNVLGARPLGRSHVHGDGGSPGGWQDQAAQGPSGGKSGRRPTSALAGISWRDMDYGEAGRASMIRQGALDSLSPLMSPLVLEMSRRRSANQKTARIEDAVRSPGLLGAAYRGSLSMSVGGGDRDGPGGGGVPGLMEGLRPQSAPASRLKGLLKKKSVSEKVSSTIGAGRTIYDEDSYNRLAVPTAEQTILSMAIDQFAAQAAIDEVMCYGREADRRGKRRDR
jgi:hypothetical protein